MEQDIRWKQRFQNFEKAFKFLKDGVEKNDYDPLQMAGLVQSFEFTFELAWKTLKDYLNQMGDDVKFPRDVIKKAYQRELIQDGHLWIQMLEKRNELSHTYDDNQAEQAIQIIRNDYFPGLLQVYQTLQKLACTD